MKLRRLTVMAATAAAAVAIGAGTANGAPVALDAPVTTGNNVEFVAKAVGHSIETVLTGGTFRIVDNVAQVVNNEGSVLESFPLSFRVNNLEFPLRAQVDGSRLTLTPNMNLSDAKPVPVAEQITLEDIASPEANSKAMTLFSQQLGIAIAVGSLVGGSIGAVVGCVFGLPLLGVGCLPGIVAGFGIGSVIGTIVAGGPTLIAAGVQLITTLNAPA